MGIAVLSVIGLALAAPLLHRVLQARSGPIFAFLPAALFIYFASFASRIQDGRPVSTGADWVPSLGLSFSFYLDGLGLLFALLITGIGALVLVYAGGYLAGHRDLGRFYGFLLFFMGSMLGLVLADDIIFVFVFWELTSISSYLLIGFEHEEPGARKAALQALLVTNAGGLAMLAGLVLLGQVSGASELSGLAAHAETVRNDGLYLPILLLILAGAFTKSAQFPFHFWLPGAMAAPTPVSAYLHSATMVKAGVYLLARLSPTLGGTDEWTWIVTTVGAVTMLVGGFVALYQTDLKRILAYSTVSALGFLVMLLGIGSPLATTAAMTFLLAHALYKGALFMTAGAIDHESGTRDVERLGGLRSAMPWTAAATGLAALSLAGFGPLLSFIGKELAFEAALDRDAGVLLAAAILLAGVSFVAVAGLNVVRPFFGPVRDTPKKPHEAGVSLWLPPLLLAVLGIVLGVAPMLVDGRLVAPAATAVLGHASHEHLALWHGLNLPLALSTLSLVLGLATYAAWDQLRAATSRWVEPVMSRGPERGYEQVLAGLNAISLLHTRVVQNGYLRAYLVVTVGVVAGLGGYTLLAKGNLEGPGGWSDVRLYHIAIAALMLVAAFTTATSPSRLVAVAALGVVGYGVALTYIVYGAPDLAMTQFMVETLTVILFLAVLYHLPRLRGLSSGLARVRDAVIALSAGAFVTALVLVTSASRQPSEVATYYAEESVPGGHGRNIVNVILVDFRALDTLGEITVLAVAAFGVYALLKYRPSRLRRGPRLFGGIATTAGNEGEGE